MKIATSIIESELSLPPTAMGRDVRMLFEAHPELLCIALVDDGRPVGLISKSAFLRRYADELGPALFERRPAALLANTAPMIVEADDPVTELLDIAENGSANELMDGFIVANQGRFAGVSSLFALLRATRARADELQFLFSDLETAHQQALAADAAKAQFLATMTHELRTPLNAILGYSELIMEEAADDAEAVCSDAQKITTAGRHLLGLINQVLDFSKIDAGQMQPEPEDFDVAAWAEETIATIRPLATQNNNELTLEIEGGAGRAFTDADRLRQCLFNLTGNACKFTSNGRVIVSVFRRAGDLHITVADTGIGLSEEQLERLFRPFSQADSSISRRFGGTGLGLSITKKTLELLGGSISVASMPGLGSTFALSVPARLGQSCEQSAAA